MQKMKIGLSALAVIAVMLTVCMISAPAAAEEGPYALGDPGVTVSTPGELAAAVAAGQSLISVSSEITLTGSTVLTVADGMEITIQSAGPLHYAIVFRGSTQLVVEGKLTLIDIDLIQHADHQSYDGSVPAQYASPWLALSGDAELDIYNCTIWSRKAYSGEMGLITSVGGTPTVKIDSSVLMSNKRAVFGQSLGMTCYITDSDVIAQSESLCRGDFVLRGTTTYGTHTLDARIYNFIGASVIGSEPGEYASFEKAGSAFCAYNPDYKIYFASSAAEFMAGTAAEYTAPAQMTADTTFYVAIGYTHPESLVTHFSTVFEITCKYRPDGGWQFCSVTLPAGEGYRVVPDGNYAPEMEYGSEFTFYLDFDWHYNRSEPIVKANGVQIDPNWNSYTVTVTEDTAITVEGVELNKYAVELHAGTGYTVVPFHYAPSMTAGALLVFTVDIDYGYNGSAMAVLMNGWYALYPVDGVYRLYVEEDMEITVAGVVLKTYTVTLTPGTGYILNGATTVVHGTPYTFTVTVVGGYDAATLVVKVDGVEVFASGGVYTLYHVSDDIVITATIDHNGNGLGSSPPPGPSGNNGNPDGNNGNGGTNNGNPNGNNGKGNGNLLP